MKDRQRMGVAEARDAPGELLRLILRSLRQVYFNRAARDLVGKGADLVLGLFDRTGHFA